MLDHYSVLVYSISRLLWAGKSLLKTSGGRAKIDAFSVMKD